MKQAVISALFISLSFMSCAQKTNNEKLVETYASFFFKEEANKFNLLKKYNGVYICPPSELDTILSRDSYSLSRRYILPVYKNEHDTCIIIWISTNRQLIGLEEYKKADIYKNSILVVFEKKDTTYTMCDFFYQPINQGTSSFTNIEIVSKEKSLELVQYGGGSFGHWYTELLFKYDLQDNQWILDSYNLYTAIWGADYTKDKLIWSKKPNKKIAIDEVYFSKFFTDTDLEDIESGFYSE